MSLASGEIMRIRTNFIIVMKRLLVVIHAKLPARRGWPGRACGDVQGEGLQCIIGPVVRRDIGEHGGIAVKSRRYVLGGYATWWAVLVALYYGLPGLRAETWGLIGLSGVGGIVAGVLINRPSRKLPWLLLAAGQASFLAGQMSFLVAQLVKTPLPFPSFADVLYLLAYPLYAAALMIFIWWRTPDRDRRSVIDALTLTVGLALLSWIYLVSPYVHNSGLSWLQRSVAMAYPLGDVLVLAMLARMLAPG